MGRRLFSPWLGHMLVVALVAFAFSANAARVSMEMSTSDATETTLFRRRRECRVTSACWLGVGHSAGDERSVTFRRLATDPPSHLPQSSGPSSSSYPSPLCSPPHCGLNSLPPTHHY